MSVVASLRKEAKSQFLENLRVLQNDVRKWCLSQSRKYDNYGLTSLYDDIHQAYKLALMANRRYISDDSLAEDIMYRRGKFNEAVAYLISFNAEIGTIKSISSGNDCLQLSNNKVKKWMKLERQIRNQIKKILKSDSDRLRKG